MATNVTESQAGVGALRSLELVGVRYAARALVDGLEVCSLAESLGGVECLIAHPAGMTHAAMTPEARETAGITEGLLRLSIGLEHVEDLRAELAAGLARAARVSDQRKAA